MGRTRSPPPSSRADASHLTADSQVSPLKFALNSLRKSCKYCNEWDDKEEFLDSLYWTRQIVSALLGLLWGIIPLRGLIGLGLYALGSVGWSLLYAGWWQSAASESLLGGERGEVLREAAGSAFCVFLIVWVLTFTALHAPAAVLAPI